MPNTPFKCPKCPAKHYYGALVTAQTKDKPTCPNCGTGLVPARGAVAER